jgi:ABC-type polysaccharide/polyol phosphate transport system ATPase subunit
MTGEGMIEVKSGNEILGADTEKPAVEVDSVSIRFMLPQDGDHGSRRRGLRSWFKQGPKREFWALRDISFAIDRGEIFGVIGGNGAGKSTLLKIIAGIFPATAGEVKTRGVVAPLLELGAAFNPDLTGMENIYFTGSIYRIPRKTIRKNIDNIIDFSGLKNFIHVPVKNYSSGMFMRLAFSLVIFFKPEIVLIDEVFSVGDEVFQQKSFQRILSFRKQGAAIVLVTHDLNLITQICDRVLVLSDGKSSFLGEPEEAVRHYQQLIKSGEGLEKNRKEPKPETQPSRWGSKDVEILSVDFVDENGKRKEDFISGDYFEARIHYRSSLKKEKPVFGVSLSTIYKLFIYGPNTLEADLPEKIPSSGMVRFIIPQLPLMEGDYLFSAAAYDKTLAHAYDHHEHMYHFRILPDERREFGSVRIQSRWRIEHE